MAISEAIGASLLVALLMFLHVTQPLYVESDHNANNSLASNSLIDSNIDCGAACQARCRVIPWQPYLCHRTCGTCCAKCGCVPSGTFGHRVGCPCYANITTRGGVLICP